jgi:hypothetical protein
MTRWGGSRKSMARHCEKPTGPARSGRPDDRLRDEAIQVLAQADWIASLSLAMTQWTAPYLLQVAMMVEPLSTDHLLSPAAATVKQLSLPPFQEVQKPFSESFQVPSPRLPVPIG